MFDKSEGFVIGHRIIVDPKNGLKAGDTVETSQPRQQSGITVTTTPERLMSDGFFVEGVNGNEIGVFKLQGDVKKATNLVLRKKGDAWNVEERAN